MKLTIVGRSFRTCDGSSAHSVSLITAIVVASLWMWALPLLQLGLAA